MKKIIASLAFAALTMGAVAAFGGMAPATGINGSWHDITFLGLNGGGYQPDNYDRVCIFCHTPHNAQADATGMNPLWSHAPATGSYSPYSWAAPANAPLALLMNADPLIGPSRLCMSCHDNVTAVDSHSAGGLNGRDNNGSTLMGASTSGSYLDSVTGATDTRYFDQDGLNRTHPIGFKYSDAIAVRTINGTNNELVDVVADPTIRFIDTVTPATGVQTYNQYTYINKTVAETLFGETYVTCASCHEVHNKNNSTNQAIYAGGTGQPHNAANGPPNFFVWAPEQGSALCLSCHLK